MSAYITDEQGRRRVQIVKAANIEILPGIVAADPAKAQPHFGELGWCELNAYNEALGRTNPKITLDNGEVIWGYQCWWQYVYGEN